MEGNNTSQNMPILCANNCGFYGNPINNNMCSQCFKQVSNADSSNASTATSAAAPSQKTEPEKPMTQLAPASVPAPTPIPTVALSEQAKQPSPEPILVDQDIQHHHHHHHQLEQQQHLHQLELHQQQQQQQPQLAQPLIPAPVAPSTQVPESSAPGGRPVQTIKGRCFMCRAKIPLAKQEINKCRCEYVFCDKHKAVENHYCDFDFAKMGKDLLTKANPKLNDKPRGGRSFTRLD